MKNYVNMNFFFGEKSKNRDRLIELVTPRQHTKNWNCPGKIGTVGMFFIVKKYYYTFWIKVIPR